MEEIERSDRQRIMVFNALGIPTGTAGALLVPVKQGAYYLNANADSTFTKASFGANVFHAGQAGSGAISDAHAQVRQHGPEGSRR